MHTEVRIAVGSLSWNMDSPMAVFPSSPVGGSLQRFMRNKIWESTDTDPMFQVELVLGTTNNGGHISYLKKLSDFTKIGRGKQSLV